MTTYTGGYFCIIIDILKTIRWGIGMGNIFFFGWEVDVILWLQTFVNGFTTLVAKFLQICGEEYVLIFVLGLLYWAIDKKVGRRASLAMVGSMLFGTLIKGLVLRIRPYMVNNQIKCVTPPHKEADIMSIKEQGYSLPSLHSTMAAATYGTIAVSIKKKVVVAICIIMPLLIGLSRPFIGVHYPTDVIAGWTLGVICIFVLGGLENKFNYKVGFLVPLVIGIAGFFYCTDTEFYSGYGVALGLFLGFLFEEKFVKFEYCKKWWTYILRPIGGVLAFLVLSLLFKIPLQFITLEETSTIALIYRLFRYTASTFVTIGVYPYLFKICKNKF